MDTVEGEDPLDISTLDAEPKADALAAEVIEPRGYLIEYQQPPLPQASHVELMTRRQMRVAELKWLFRQVFRIVSWIVFAIGVALFAGGFGESLEKKSDGPEVMAIGGLFIGLAIPLFIRRAN